MNKLIDFLGKNFVYIIFFICLKNTSLFLDKSQLLNHVRRHREQMYTKIDKLYKNVSTK